MIITDMKFQLLIARIMHGFFRPASVTLALGGLISMTGCVSLTAKKNTYGTSASSPAVKVNGADIRMQVKPEGTENGSFVLSAMVVSAAFATLEGPFRLRIEATGEKDQQTALVLHRFRTRTGKSKRDEWYPAAHLGKQANFKLAAGESRVTRAVYPIPGLLKVKSKEDGPLEFFVDLTVTAKGRNERKLVRFKMDPSQKRQDEFIFLPTEIINNIGKSPDEWVETGWD
jgi:hypothetical protein